MMSKRKKCIALALYIVLMLYTIQSAAAVNYAWGDLLLGFDNMISDNSESYPQLPLSFKLEGKDMILPCELSTFLSFGWDIYDRNTGDYMAMYETVAGYDHRNLILKKNNKEIWIELKNNMPYEQEMADCDVEEFTIFAHDCPEVEFNGIRIGMSQNSLPKWAKVKGKYSFGNTKCSTSASDESYMLMSLDSVGYYGYIYYSIDDLNKVDYISANAENK